MTTLIICFFIAFLCFVFMTVKVFRQWKLIRALKEEAEAYKVTAETLQKLYDESKQPDFSEVLVHAEYCTSDSDLMKYTSQKSMEAAIKSKMAMMISNDLLKKFEPSILPLGEGKEKYSLTLKVRKI